MKWMCTLIICFCLTNSHAQSVEYKTFAAVDSFLDNRNDTLYIVNFWATWCKPCIEELPLFDSVTAQNKNTPIKVILISLDAQIRWEDNLVPFLNNHAIQSTVWAIYKERPTDWIDLVDPRWQGTIPATLMFNNARQINYFHETSFTEATLNEKLKELIHL